MLLTILSVHTAAIRGAAIGAGASRAGAANRGAATMGMLAWEKLPLLMIGFCLHFLNFRAYADGRADLYE